MRIRRMVAHVDLVARAAGSDQPQAPAASTGGPLGRSGRRPEPNASLDADTVASRRAESGGRRRRAPRGCGASRGLGRWRAKEEDARTHALARGSARRRGRWNGASEGPTTTALRSPGRGFARRRPGNQRAPTEHGPRRRFGGPPRRRRGAGIAGQPDAVVPGEEGRGGGQARGRILFATGTRRSGQREVRERAKVVRAAVSTPGGGRASPSKSGGGQQLHVRVVPQTLRREPRRQETRRGARKRRQRAGRDEAARSAARWTQVHREGAMRPRRILCRGMVESARKGPKRGPCAPGNVKEDVFLGRIHKVCGRSALVQAPARACDGMMELVWPACVWCACVWREERSKGG